VQAGDKTVPVQLASETAIQADEQVKNLVKGTQEGRWLAFRLEAPLPPDTPVTVIVGPGTPSAEGPILTEDPYSFKNHARAGIVEHHCGWSEAECGL
jgi:hypothetical protein